MILKFGRGAGARSVKASNMDFSVTESSMKCSPLDERSLEGTRSFC